MMKTVKTSLCLTLVLIFQGSVSGQTVSQTPHSLSVRLGDTVTMSCTASSGVDADLSWYLLKPGQAPKLLFYNINSRHSDTPSHYSSSGSEPDFTFTITGFKAEDAGEYFCLGVYNGPVYTFGGGTKLVVDLGVQRPTLTVLPPSREELQRGSASLVCAASGGFPSDWTLGWRVGGSSSTEGSHSPGVMGSDGRYSWTSVLSLSADRWARASVTCEASRSGQSPVTQILEPQSCSE